MNPFDYTRVESTTAAITSGSRAAAKFIAGGTNLVDLMKCDVERPMHVVDLNALQLTAVERVAGGLRIDALAKMSDVAVMSYSRRRATPRARRNKLHSPIGLDLGSETPEEIALSIVAEMQAVMHRRRGGPLQERDAAIHEGETAACL